MSTIAAHRKRYSADSSPTPGLRRIIMGAFGFASPESQLSSEVSGFNLNPYQYHEGDLITPGTGNWVLDPYQETPVVTIWGNAFLRNPNTFSPVQTPQVMASPRTVTNGIGGLVAGSLALQPLYATAPEQG